MSAAVSLCGKSLVGAVPGHVRSIQAIHLALNVTEPEETAVDVASWLRTLALEG
jgi:hypothetical protein